MELEEGTQANSAATLLLVAQHGRCRHLKQMRTISILGSLCVERRLCADTDPTVRCPQGW
jgi:hypothetical protein